MAGKRLFLSGASSWAEDLVDFHGQVDLASEPGELQRSTWAGGEKAISLPPAPPALLAQARALLAAKDPTETRTQPRSQPRVPVPDWTAMARGSAGALPALAQLVMPYPAGWSPGGPRGFWGRLATQVNELVDCPVEVVAHTVTQDIAIPPARGAGSPTHSRIVRCRHRLAAGHAQVVEPEHDDAGALAVETALDAGGLTQAGVSRVDFAHEGDCDSQAAQVASWLREQKLERALPAGGAIPVRKTRM